MSRIRKILSMKLYLVRHGEAEPKELNPDCPLSGRGRKEAETVARFLGDCGVRIARINHSGKTRAAQTARIMAGVVAPGQEIERMEGLRPMDPVRGVADLVGRLSKDTMLVGHMPFMSKLASELVTGGDTWDIVMFDTCSLVCLERTESGGWIILWAINPRMSQNM